MNKTNKPDAATLKPKLKTMKLAKLQEYPDQENYFSQYGAYEYEALKADIDANDLTTRIEVMPANNAAGLAAYTIISGHTRRKALLELGKTETKVRIRYDLTHATRDQIDADFLLSNAARRQLDRFDQIKTAIKLYSIKSRQNRRGADGKTLNLEALREQIGKDYKMSGRNFARYVKVFESPIEVQEALRNKDIKLVEAARVGSLSPQKQQRLARRLRQGEDAKTVFAAFFPPQGKGHVKANNALASYARSIKAAHEDLAQRLEEVGIGCIRKNAKTLRLGQKLTRTLLLRTLDEAG